MIAPTTCVQTNGYKIALDAFDICVVKEDEDDDGSYVEVTYAITHKTTGTFQTRESFSDVLGKYASARHEAQNPTEEGDEWRQ